MFYDCTIIALDIVECKDLLNVSSDLSRQGNSDN